MLKCPVCQSESNRVIDSRGKRSGELLDGYIRRRRECTMCGTRFTTFEITQKDYQAYLEFQKILRKAGYVRVGG